MSSAAQRALRAGALLLLPCLGLALWLLRPGHPVTVAALLVCPGWGALRLLSVIDRRFGICGASLCLSVLALAAATLVGARAGLQPEQLGLAVQLGTLCLCLLGSLRLAIHRRWQAGLPPHPAPMPLWPEQAGWCLALLALTLAAVTWASPISHPAAGNSAFFQAAAADSWLRQGEEPLQAGVPQPPSRVLACAAAALSAGSGLHPVRAVQLLSLACLAATLLLAAEAVARLRGNRGALAAMLAVLLLLDPLGLLLEALPRTSGRGRIGVALEPFLHGDARVVTLACTALLLSATLSVLRRASFHVPRLAGVAAFGLVLSAPAAAVLLLPGWLVGIALAHLVCRDSPDNDPRDRNPVRRPGEPRWLRAPFFALAIPIAAGGVGALLITGRPALVALPLLPAALALALALGAGLVLCVPGVRWLNKGPGAEAWFFIGLLLLAGPAALLVSPVGERAVETSARLLGLLLAVPAAVAVLRVIELPGRQRPIALSLVALLAGSASVAAVRQQRIAEHPCHAPATDGPCRVAPGWVAPDYATALAELRTRSPQNAVLVPPAHAPAQSGALLALLAGRSLLIDPGAGPATPDDSRAALADELVRGDTALLLPLRSRAGLGARELWAVNEGPCWPGFLEVARWDTQALLRAPVPDIVLVTVPGLRADQLGGTALPRSAALLERGLHFDQAFTPLPATLPALASLLYGLSPPEHGLLSDDEHVRGSVDSLPAVLCQSGYRTVAFVALEQDGGLLDDFERAVRAPAAPAGELVDEAIAALAGADRRPLFLWLHLGDLLRDGSPAAQRAALDKALARLLASVPEHSLLVLAAPWARPAPGRDAPPLAESSVHVPLVVSGAGLPAAHSGLLTALQDLPALILRGELPERDGVFLMLPRESPPTAGGEPDAATAASAALSSAASAPEPPARTARDDVRWGLRSLARKTLLVPGEPPSPPAGWSYDLAADPDELDPRPATPDEVAALLAWRALAFK